MWKWEKEWHGCFEILLTGEYRCICQHFVGFVVELRTQSTYLTYYNSFCFSDSNSNSLADEAQSSVQQDKRYRHLTPAYICLHIEDITVQVIPGIPVHLLHRPDRAVALISAVRCLPPPSCLWMMPAIWSLILSSSSHLAMKIHLHLAPSVVLHTLLSKVSTIHQVWIFSI